MERERCKIKQLFWVGASLSDLKKLPEDVKDVFGYALYKAQIGEKHPTAKPLKGLAGAGVMEIVEVHDTNTYRAVYTVKLADTVYVLHVFQKKAKSGIAAPKKELELIKARLQRAIEHHAGKEEE